MREAVKRLSGLGAIPSGKHPALVGQIKVCENKLHNGLEGLESPHDYGSVCLSTDEIQPYQVKRIAYPGTTIVGIEYISVGVEKSVR
jgi:hypothetical protein